MLFFFNNRANTDSVGLHCADYFNVGKIKSHRDHNIWSKQTTNLLSQSAIFQNINNSVNKCLWDCNMTFLESCVFSSFSSLPEGAKIGGNTHNEGVKETINDSSCRASIKAIPCHNRPRVALWVSLQYVCFSYFIYLFIYFTTTELHWYCSKVAVLA